MSMWRPQVGTISWRGMEASSAGGVRSVGFSNQARIRPCCGATKTYVCGWPRQIMTGSADEVKGCQNRSRLVSRELRAKEAAAADRMTAPVDASQIFLENSCHGGNNRAFSGGGWISAT